MKRSFSLVELIIVVAVLGILAAIAMPSFQDYITEAKAAAAKDTLRILRNAIGIYAGRHNDVPPGYQNNNPDSFPVLSMVFYNQMYFVGHYLSEMPENPFNGDARVIMIQNNGTFPEDATGERGWIYKPAMKTIRLDWPGVDGDGIRYYDY